MSCLMWVLGTKPGLSQEQQVGFIADPLSSSCKEDILIKKLKLGSERNRGKKVRGRKALRGREWKRRRKEEREGGREGGNGRGF